MSSGFHKKVDGVVLKNFPGYFLVACILITAFFLYNILEPFLTTLILAAILATAFHPLYKKILPRVKNNARSASLVTCSLILFLIVVPMMIFVFLLGKQATNTYSFVYDWIQTGHLDTYLKWEKGGTLYDTLGSMAQQVDTVIDVSSLDVKGNISDGLRQVGSFLASQSTMLIKLFGWILLSFFVLFFAMYYFFKDTDQIIKKIMTLSPLPLEHEHELFKKFKEISLATLYGIFLTSIVQGIIGGVGFLIAGIPNSLFWGTAIAFFSLVPVVGTATIWLPASIILFLSGNVFGGIFLFCWGLFIVSTVDNILRA